MRTHLIDEHGDVLTPSRGLTRKFGTWLGPADLSDYLVRNMGYVALNVGRGEVGYWVRPDRVCPKALVVSLHLLHDAGAPRHRVVWHDKVWHSESFTSRNRAIQHISDLVKVAHAIQRQKDFLTRPRKREHLPRAGALRQLLDAWGAGTTTVEGLLSLRPVEQLTRYIVVSPLGPSAHPHIVGGGGGFDHFRRWITNPDVRRLEDCPDVAYGQWAADSYRSAWRQAQPRIEDLDCTVQIPRVGPVRDTYSRVIVPCTTVSGGRALLGIMQSEPHIDLRAQVH